MDNSLILVLENAGVAGVVVLLIIFGLLVTGREHKKLERAFDKSQEALALERQRNADLTLWMFTGTRALQAVAQVAEERSAGGSSPQEVKAIP